MLHANTLDGNRVILRVVTLRVKTLCESSLRQLPECLLQSVLAEDCFLTLQRERNTRVLLTSSAVRIYLSKKQKPGKLIWAKLCHLCT